jgi:hypothetical protein
VGNASEREKLFQMNDFSAVLPHTTALHETIHPHEHSVCTVLCTSWSGTKDGNADASLG